MRTQIKINPKTGITYIPDNIREEGFKGEIELLANAKTVTLFLPGASLDEIERSLLIVLEDVRLRKGTPRQKGESHEKLSSNKSQSEGLLEMGAARTSGENCE